MEEVEEWRGVLDGYYEVSNLGRVRRAKAGPSTRVGRIINPIVSQYGYSEFSASYNGSRRMVRVHQLVALAFLGDPPSADATPNHKNGIKTDNCVGNLEWATPQQQMDHAVANDLTAHGIRVCTAKLHPMDVVEIRVRYSIAAQLGRKATAKVRRELSAKFGVTPGIIWGNAVGRINRRVGGPIVKPHSMGLDRNRPFGDTGS